MPQLFNKELVDKSGKIIIVYHLSNKRKQIIAKLKSKYWQRTHKYGFRIPKDVDDAKRIDEENGITVYGKKLLRKKCKRSGHEKHLNL